MSAATSDQSLKVQMFRFVDVLPRLRQHDDVTRHLQEYFEEIREHLPLAVELVRFGVENLKPNGVLSRALAYNARYNAVRMARRFIAGETSAEIAKALLGLRRQGFAATLDLLGEAVISEAESEQYLERYLSLVDELSGPVARWPEDQVLDYAERWPLPRLNLSIKLSALTSHYRPIDPVGTTNRVAERLRRLFRAARENNVYIHIDMEQYEYKALTQHIFCQVLMEPEFRDWDDVGIVVQCYLRDADADLNRLLAWTQQRGTPIAVRLVKGAYWDFETVLARQRGWASPVYDCKWESDAAFERGARFLLENRRWLKPAFGSHNVRSLAHCIALAEELQAPPGSFELQMLFGMGSEQAEVYRDLGHRVRIYTPFGDLIPGMAYLVRRLLENTSNDSFLRHGFAEDLSLEELLMSPTEVGARQPAFVPPAPLPFENEPLSDFSQAHIRDQMQAALDTVAEQLGQEYAIVITGKRIDRRQFLVSRNPSQKSQVVGKVATATVDDTLAAIAAARRGYNEWSRVSPNYRAEYIELVADQLRERRFELAAWQCYEVGKPWAEADAEVAEAIDFCRYYAQQMRAIATPQEFDLPGEENSYVFRSRGVVVVIAPWNFPLAILTGMTVAALVAGNSVIVKPAEQSSVIAAKLMEVLAAAGVPDHAVQFLPGVGEDIGPTLVSHPEVDLIAFTGSRAVGLEINHLAAAPQAAQHSVKHVIAEMGGKNAMIVDSDADLDEAVLGVMHSAFGYAGQKCSACSRVIVVGEAHDEFLARLCAATQDYHVGPATEPGSMMGPVIDEAAYERIRSQIEAAQLEARLVLAVEPAKAGPKGYYIGPHIFADVLPSSALAREEIFGPVLAVFRAKDFAEALAIANDSEYALTGGVYSRSPAHLKKARQEFMVGNLYLNRGITGALVGRQPFGGFRMSGIGSKAGGPDYLKQFLTPVNITENTLRRGFAPPEQTEPVEAAEAPPVPKGKKKA